MRASIRLASILPFVSMVAGTAVAAWRFRGHDPVGGLAAGLGGTVLMIVLAISMPESEDS